VHAGQLLAAEGKRHHHADRVEVSGQEGNQVTSGAIRPVKILHDQQQRRLGRQPLDHAEQQIEQATWTGTRSAVGRTSPAAPGGIVKQAAHFLLSRADDRRQLDRAEFAGKATKRLDDRRERQALLAERHAAAAQHAHALPPRGASQLAGQPGLASPRLPADQNQHRLTADGTAEQVAKQCQLPGTADEPARHACLQHGVSMPRNLLTTQRLLKHG